MTEERVKSQRDIIQAEGGNLQQLERERGEVQADIAESEETIQTLQEELKEVSEKLEERTKEVEEAKKKMNRAAKVVDQAVKEVVTHVSGLDCLLWKKTDGACRTTRSRNLAWSGRVSTESAGWTRSSFL